MAVAWAETQPAGVFDKNWYVAEISDDGSTLLAGVQGGRLYLSTDSGAIWNEAQPAGAFDKNWFHSAMSPDGTKIIVMSQGGRIWYTSNSGANWTEVRPDGDRNYGYCMVGISDDGTKLVMAEYQKRVWYSTNSGAGWTEIRPNGDASRDWNVVALSSDGSIILAAIWNGRVYYSTDSGANWSEIQPKGAVNGAWQMWKMSGDGTKIIIGELGGSVYYSANSGANWSVVLPGGQWYGAGISSDGTKQVACGSAGRLYSSFNSGVSWQEERPLTIGNNNKNWQWAIDMSSDGVKRISGIYGGRIYLGTYTAGATNGRYINTASAVGGAGLTNNTVGVDRAFNGLNDALPMMAGCNFYEDLDIQCCGAVADGTDYFTGGVYVQSTATCKLRGNPTDPNGANTTGVYDATKYRINTSGAAFGLCVSNATAQRFIFEDLQIIGVIGWGIYINCPLLSGSIIRRCIISPTINISIFIIAAATLEIKNCVMVNAGTGVSCTNAGAVATVYNSIVRGCTLGVQAPVGTVTVKNCSVFDNVDDFLGVMTIDHCASDDGDGTNPVAVPDWAAQFYNVNYAADVDFRLKLGSVLLAAGIGPAVDPLVPTDDIVGVPRAGLTASVGPFEHEQGWSPTETINLVVIS